MTHHSPHKSPPAYFATPWPPSNHLQEISVKEILEQHCDDPELLKCILTAKSEEDKKKTARDTLRAEEARIQLRQMDLEIAKEQSRPRYQSTENHEPAYPHSAHPLCPQFYTKDRACKRTRLIPNEEQLTHNKVMEALKAKIQRTSQPVKDTRKKRLAPIIQDTKSAKPILPPIDTSIGKVDIRP